MKAALETSASLSLRSGRTRPRSLLGGMSSREIAKLLGVSHGTVQNIERRALAKMRAEAERIGVEQEDLRDFLASGGRVTFSLIRDE